MSSLENGPGHFERKKLTDIPNNKEVKDTVLENIEVSINQMKSFANTTQDVPSNGGSAGFQYSQGHIPRRYNIAKEVNLWLGNSTEKKGDWHEKDYNGICSVSQRIRLYPENLDNITLKFQHNYKDIKEVGGMVGGIMSEVKKVVELKPLKILHRYRWMGQCNSNFISVQQDFLMVLKKL